MRTNLLVSSLLMFLIKGAIKSDNVASNTKDKIKKIDQTFSEDGRQQCFGEISQVSKI